MTEKEKQMQAIEKELVDLKSSPLYAYRTSNNYMPVVGEGSCDAAILFVGEAPGKNEAKTGKPFCGTAGNILDELLASAGIDRKDIYISNIVKDRPPENRDPTPKEIEVYGPFLDRQMSIIKPRVIVSLGRYAMGYIMNAFGLRDELEPIGKAHGKVYHVKDQGILKAFGVSKLDIVTLYHPCVAVYNRSTLPSLKADITILKTYAKNTYSKKGLKK